MSEKDNYGLRVSRLRQNEFYEGEKFPQEVMSDQGYWRWASKDQIAR